MKKFFYLILTVFGIFIIYTKFNLHKINYVSIGDNLIKGLNPNNINCYGYNDYIKEYLINNDKLGDFNNYFYNKTIEGLTKNIKDNRTIRINNQDYFIKKVLRESDILVISIGMESLNLNYDKYDINKNYRYFNKMYIQIENLIKEVKKYAQGTIIFLGYYNPFDYYDSKTDELFYDMDIKLNELLTKDDIIYIDLYEIIKGKNFKNKDKTPYLETEGYKKIANIIEYYIE